MAEDAMGNDKIESGMSGKTRGRRRPPTIEATADDITVPEVPEPHLEPLQTPDDSTSDQADHSMKPAEVSLGGDPIQTEHASSTPEPENVRAEAPRVDQSSKSAFVPLVIAAMLGGGVSLGAAALFGAFPGGQAAPAQWEARLAALEKRPATADPAIQLLSAQVEKLSADFKRLPASSGNIASDLSPIEKRLAVLEASLNDVGHKAEAGQASAETTGRKVETQQQQTQSQVSALNQQLTDASGKLSALAAQQTKGNTAPILAVLSSLKVALDRGKPFATEIAALAALGVPPAKLEPLRPFAEKGVAPANEIAKQFVAVAVKFTAQPKSDPSLTFTQRLLQGASNLVEVLPADGSAPGDSVPAIVSRIQAAITQGDADQATAEVAKLPAQYQQQAHPMLDLIKARQNAIAAVSNLEQDVFASIAAQARQP